MCKRESDWSKGVQIKVYYRVKGESKEESIEDYHPFVSLFSTLLIFLESLLACRIYRKCTLKLYLLNKCSH